jgi:hypothetical protein
MPKPDMIKGWPNPTEAETKTFQRNHKLKPDGIIGPKTRSKIWRKRKHKAGYTHLIDHKLTRGGATVEQRYLRKYLEQNPALVALTTLPIDAIIRIIFFLTSEWKTGLSYLSTQDGVTIGSRRLASSTLQGFLRDNPQFSRHFDDDDWERVIEERPEHKDRRGERGEGWIPDANNGFPLDEPILRESFLRMSEDPLWWNAQIVEMCLFIEDVVAKYPKWTNARLITLACRAGNSGSSYDDDLPTTNERRAYRKLRKKYWKLGSTKQRRIKRIESLIPEDETWERVSRKCCDDEV